MFVKYAECNGEIIMYFPSSINPIYLIPYLVSSQASSLPGVFAPSGEEVRFVTLTM